MTSSPVDLLSLGLSPEHVYRHAIQYCSTYTTHLNYQDKCTLVALNRQASSHTTNECSSLFEVDEEDWVRDWNKVRYLTPVEAMSQFSALLSHRSDQFSLWMSDLYTGSNPTTQQLLSSSTPTNHRPAAVNLNSYKRPSHFQTIQSPAASAAYKSNRTIEDVIKAARETDPSDLTPEDNGEKGVQPGYLWCKRSGAAEFILNLREEPEARVLISPGESITIKVPVCADVATLSWEFATERYDVGFGAELELCTDTQSLSQQPELTEIIPKERRLCCEDVIVGCHRATSAPELKGQRTYYLRFDNKYSLLTSKVLYYRVYCRAPSTEAL